MNPDISDLRQAVRRQDAILLAQAIDCFEMKLLSGHVGEAEFRELVDALCQPEFADMMDGYTLLLSVELNWQLLTDSQREELLPILENLFVASKDWMTRFVISELLGSFYKDRNALNALLRLSGSVLPTVRVLVPHGLEHLVKDSPEVAVRRSALSALRRMAEDPELQVVQEAKESLERLKSYPSQINFQV